MDIKFIVPAIYTSVPTDSRPTSTVQRDEGRPDGRFGLGPRLSARVDLPDSPSGARPTADRRLWIPDLVRVGGQRRIMYARLLWPQRTGGVGCPIPITRQNRAVHGGYQLTEALRC